VASPGPNWKTRKREERGIFPGKSERGHITAQLGKGKKRDRGSRRCSRFAAKKGKKRRGGRFPARSHIRRDEGGGKTGEGGGRQLKTHSYTSGDARMPKKERGKRGGDLGLRCGKAGEGSKLNPSGNPGVWSIDGGKRKKKKKAAPKLKADNPSNVIR